ncbi:hypothetical protein V8G54_032820 [Vigna mungo]|uniref:Uncharacterized protein n=1 Tax=Vigna mungo TaxID=3915 RepID=A0AAQ3RIA8_VIGMU
MKGATGPNGRSLIQLDSVKQAIVLFINAKLTINPEHCFSFATLSNTISWVRKDFPFDIDSTMVAMRSISASSSAGPPDLIVLFRLDAHEAKKSRVQGRIFRVIMFCCRSSEQPQHQASMKQKVFTLDSDPLSVSKCLHLSYSHITPTPDLILQTLNLCPEAGRNVLGFHQWLSSNPQFTHTETETTKKGRKKLKCWEKV